MFQTINTIKRIHRPTAIYDQTQVCPSKIDLIITNL